MKRVFTFFVLSVFLIVAGGCGYTATTLLPPDIKSIHVANFTNKIDPAKEVSDKRSAFFYRPGMETEITKAVIDEFIFDRHLDIMPPKQSDLLMEGQLVDLQEYPLSYSSGGGSITESRVEVFVDIEVYDNRSGDLLWKENSFMGQFDFDISGPAAIPEAAAIKGAIRDLAKRIVERTVESW